MPDRSHGSSLKTTSSGAGHDQGHPLSSLVCTLEDVQGKLRRRLLEWSGIGWSPRIVPYRGFGTDKRIRVLARVLENRGGLNPNLERGLWGGLHASWVRYRTAELPNVPVTLRWGTFQQEFQTDEEGFLDEEITPPDGTKLGLHHLTLRVTGLGSRADEVALPVQVHARAGFGVVSDIDDTLIDSHISNRWSRARAMFLSEVRARRPFSDAAELCTQLLSEGPDRPIVYVSSSPWNLHDHLEHFFASHDFPAGPILLRDWGFRRDGFAPDGRHGHKRKKIAEVLALYEGLPFVLIGDSSQEDPHHYLALAREMPERIKAVLIRRVSSKPERLARLPDVERAFSELQIPFLVFDGSQDPQTLLAQVFPED